MTLSGTELIAIVVVLIVGFAMSYVFALKRLKSMITERQLKTADQLAALDQAIRALETRLTEHPALHSKTGMLKVVGEAVELQGDESLDGVEGGEGSGEIAAEIQAAIAAATVVALGPGAVVKSVKPALSPWSQQGRVMVQGGHNLRVRS